MNKQIPIILAFTFLFSPLIAAGQSLSELMDEGKDRNLELKALHQEYRAALEVAPQVSQLPNPEVGVGTFIAPVETRLGGQRVAMSASQMFPWFGTLDARKDVALTRAQAMWEKVASTELELFYQIKVAYLKLYEVASTREIITRNIRIFNALRELALARLENGMGSVADILRVDLKLRELNQELSILEEMLEKPLSDLNQILNRPAGTPVELEDSLSFTSIPYAMDSLIAHIQAQHPALRLFSLQQEVSRRTIELNHLEGKPSFGVGMNYVWVDSRSDADPLHNGRDIFQVSAKVSIPIFREKFRAREREENLRIDALEHRKDDLVNRFRSMIEKAFSNHETARLKFDLYNNQIVTTRATIEILETDYSATGRHFDELLRLERELVDYDLNIIKAIVQSHMAKAAIERYITF